MKTVLIVIVLLLIVGGRGIRPELVAESADRPYRR